MLIVLLEARLLRCGLLDRPDDAAYKGTRGVVGRTTF
jgi:hypothetical protein